MIVRADTSLPAGEGWAARLAARRIGEWLTEAGIPYAAIDESEAGRIDAGHPSVLIFPYNPQLSPELLRATRAHVKRGGSCIVFFSSSEALADLMGIRIRPYIETKDIARWRSIRFADPESLQVPRDVYQQAWNQIPVKPKGHGAATVGTWADAFGRDSGENAVVRTPAGYWFTTLLRDDDARGKSRMLRGLIGSLDLSIWRDAARRSYEQVQRIDGYTSFPSIVASIRQSGQRHPNRETLDAFAARADAMYRHMQEQMKAGVFRGATLTGDRLRELLVMAYSMAQAPRPGEIRGIWDHDAVGWYPGDWDRTCRILAESGINTIFINALWGGLAHYESRTVPSSHTYRIHGDQLAQCIRAARKYGLKVHLWKICWNLENAPADFRGPMKKQGRLQEKADGTSMWWMNPAHPDNRRQELTAIREALERYDIDGFHLDYIRYPSGEADYSAYSRRAFEAATGRKVSEWPRDVLSGGRHADAYRRWRADIITSFVRDVRSVVDTTKPGTELTAAVWGAYPVIVQSIGQDWGRWLKEGLIDYAIPMNYAEELHGFTSLIDRQIDLTGKPRNLLPGIGVTAAESQLDPDQVIEQILAVRKRNLPGFVLFDLSKTVETETLPALERGLLRGD